MARPWQARTAETVARLAGVSWYDLTRYGQPPHQRCAERRWWVAVDRTPLPLGAKAAGSARTGMGRNRRTTGRQVWRWIASAYRELLHEPLRRGKAAAVPAWQVALGALDPRLGWTREQRQRLVLRLDGGCGTTAVRHGLLRRGDPGVATRSHRGRVRQLRQASGPGQPPSRPGREIAAVVHPHRLGRTTRPWGRRTPQAKGGAQDAGLVTPWTDLEPAALAEAYDGRATLAASFCQDTPAWGRVPRRQRRWAAQEMGLRVARLAPHLRRWGTQWLSRVPATCGRCRG
jgi:hypothetical protein